MRLINSELLRHLKNYVKRIRNDEVIKHFVYLVNKIDWVIMWHRDTIP